MNYRRVYIDWNQDGDFLDFKELAASVGIKNNGDIKTYITVPTNAVLGTTRMRVMMKKGARPTSSCELFPFGEVEDYSIQVVSTNVSAGDETR